MKLFLLALIFSLSLHAHNLHHTIVKSKDAAVVQFMFTTAGDFSFQEYELYAPDDAKIPAQVGRTDRLGRVVFVPDERGVWKLIAISEDGHGKTIEIEIGETIDTETQTSSVPYREIIALLVLALIFGALYVMTKRRENV